jgi:hypothetical protein
MPLLLQVHKSRRLGEAGLGIAEVGRGRLGAHRVHPEFAGTGVEVNRNRLAWRAECQFDGVERTRALSETVGGDLSLGVVGVFAE